MMGAATAVPGPRMYLAVGLSVWTDLGEGAGWQVATVAGPPGDHAGR